MNHRFNFLFATFVSVFILTSESFSASNKSGPKAGVLIEDRNALRNSHYNSDGFEIIDQPLVDSTTGAIFGVVTGLDGGWPILDYEVSVVEIPLQDTTYAGGAYGFDNLMPGIYSLFLHHLYFDYIDTTVVGIQVVAGETTFVDIDVPVECPYILGDINADGDATPWSDVWLFVRYFKGLVPALPSFCGPCPHDVNGNGSLNGIDVGHLVNYWKGTGNLIPGATCPAQQPDPVIPPSGIDVGFPDTIIIGNLDLTPTIAAPGDTVDIPIWVKNDENVAGLNMAFAADSSVISEWLGGTLQPPLSLWGDCTFSAPDSDRILAGYITESIRGYSDNGPDRPDLITYGDYLQVASLRFVVGASAALTQDTTQLLPGNIGRIGGTAFGDSIGVNEWEPETEGGVLIVIVAPPSGCAYVPGDISGNGEANGIDVVFGVSYFRGNISSIPPDTCADCPNAGQFLLAAGDANGNCQFNGIDVLFLVAYFRETQPSILYCVDCPPGGGVANKSNPIEIEVIE
jgi:hypothetical protein